MDWTFYFAAQHGKSLSIRNSLCHFDRREKSFLDRLFEDERKRWQMLPSVTKARYVRDYLIEVKFNDGKKKVVDFEPWLTGPFHVSEE
jgi:hypothetical protein